MKIQMSKSQWQFIGKQAGWIKIAQLSTEEIQEAWNSSEEDIKINDKGEAFYTGELISKPVDGSNPDYKAIADWMNKEKFWPNIWQINDHGNVEMLSIDSNGNVKYLGGMV